MIPGIGDRTTTVGPSSTSALGDLGEDTFLQLMVAQMQYQNPMEPTDPTTMIQQTSLMTQVEAMRDVLELQQQLIGFQEVTLASGLVGQTVVAETEDGVVEGVVEGVRFTPEGPMMTVDGRELSLGDTRQVVASASGATTATTAPADGAAATEPAEAAATADTDAIGATDPTATDPTATEPGAEAETEEPTATSATPTTAPATADEPSAPPVATGVAPATADPAAEQARTWAAVASATIGGRARASGDGTDASASRGPADVTRGGLRRAWL